MSQLTDYEEQTESQNHIRNMVISAMRRMICYNQTVYDDVRLEKSEYAGLQLSVRDSTVGLVDVQKQYGNAVVLILDDDSQLLSY